MPLVDLREPESLVQALLPWLHARLPDAEQIELAAPAKPENGGSSDTFFLEPCICERGVERREAWVLRIQATGFQIYKDPSVERQFRVLDQLGRIGNVPVPRSFWLERDEAVLGAPFFLMERIAGELPASTHHTSGAFVGATPAARESMWFSAVETMAKIHGSDTAPFAFLDRPELGRTGLDQELAAWDEFMQWSGAPVRPEQERALRWLGDHMPAERPTGLAWGDARPGNMIFRENECVAVIDWETVSLGGAEMDLGWWLFFDWFVSEGMGNSRLAGLPDAEATIRAWEQFFGRKAQAMEWHAVFATWRYSLISDRARHLLRLGGQQGAVPPESANPIPARLAQLIAE